MLATTLDSKFSKNPFERMDSDCGDEDIFTPNHPDSVETAIQMRNAVPCTLAEDRDVCGFLDSERKDNGFAETRIMSISPQHEEDLIIQHSSPYIEEIRLEERIPDETVMEQKMACEAEESTHSQEGLKSYAALPQIMEQPLQKKTKGNKEPKAVTKPKAAPKRQSQMVEESAEVASSTAAPKNKKKDQRKNMYGYSFKHILREFFSQEYKEFLAKLCRKHGVSDPEDIVSFYREKLLWSISLSNVLTLLDYEAHSVASSEHKIIKAFHNFYVWYMRKRYILHIMRSTEIQHKEEYIKATRVLIYLPRIRKTKLNEPAHSTGEQSI